MAFNYYRSTWCGSAAANKNNEEIEACAVLVATLRKKRRWGGSVVGHKMKNRDRIGGDIQLNNDYFIERSLFNPEQFRRRRSHRYGQGNLETPLQTNHVPF
ncbi:hypothetical protein Zm00014a_024494 [Zea mays]|uniref:Uncharacterized protein n=1 Tax=Zea mays TaxID=4577 RepID=A0A3L6GBD1_MAIZE|nr:hypothetical protein Zm00014a_024494 [Zea mays]